MRSALVLTFGLVSGLRRQSKTVSARLERSNASSCDASQCSNLQSFLQEQVANEWECGATELIVGHPKGECCRAHEKLRQGVLPMYSASKIIGGYTLLALVDAGLLSLDTKVGDILDWFNTNDKRKKITLRHLMSMTSGLVPPDDDTEPGDNACRPGDADDRACTRVTRSGSADREPGTTWRYSQVDLAVAGEMAEQVTGIDTFHDIFKEYLAKPHGVNTRRCFWLPPLGRNHLNVAGGLKCHIEEFAKIMQAISDRTLLRDKTLFAEAERPHTLGLMKSDPGGRQKCTDDGLAAGCKDDMMPAWFFGGRDGWKDGVFFHYGLTQWVECATAACDGGILRTSSPGLFGAYPWIDRGGLTGAQPHWGIIFRWSAKEGGFCWPIQLELLPISSKIVVAR